VDVAARDGVAARDNSRVAAAMIGSTGRTGRGRSNFNSGAGGWRLDLQRQSEDAAEESSAHDHSGARATPVELAFANLEPRRLQSDFARQHTLAARAQRSHASCCMEARPAAAQCGQSPARQQFMTAGRVDPTSSDRAVSPTTHSREPEAVAATDVPRARDAMPIGRDRKCTRSASNGCDYTGFRLDSNPGEPARSIRQRPNSRRTQGAKPGSNVAASLMLAVGIDAVACILKRRNDAKQLLDRRFGRNHNLQ
jgi:hypothetical protein